jgi:cell division protein FtsL
MGIFLSFVIVFLVVAIGGIYLSYRLDHLRSRVDELERKSTDRR